MCWSLFRLVANPFPSRTAKQQLYMAMENLQPRDTPPQVILRINITGLHTINVVVNINVCVHSSHLDCTNGADPKVLPAVRAPVKSSEPPANLNPTTDLQGSCSQNTAEAWLEEARREAGISKPYTVSQSLFV